MIIAETTRHKKWPQNIKTKAERLKYMAGGVVTVGKFGILTDTGFDDAYIPRIRGKNIVAARDYTHPGYKTPDQAYSKGVLMKKQFAARATSLTGPARV